MQVIIPTNGDYNKLIREFIRFGGPHGQAARKAAMLEVQLRTGVDVRSMTTDHGESRIKGCVKYDLGNGFRLVTVQQGEVVILLFIGDHDATQRWLDKNARLEVVVSQSDWRVELTVPSSTPPWRVNQTEAVTPTNVPFLKRVSGVEWEAVVTSVGAQFFLLDFDEDDDDEKLLRVLNELQIEQPREADLCLTVINQLKAGQLDAALAAVDVYLGKATPVSDEVPLTEEVFRAEPNQGRFIILNDLGEAELERYHDPLRFREWMTCLHSGQRRVVNEDFVGPVLLTGVSGSGKTCVLVHRAKHLAQFFGKDRILILTLNRSLARLIEILVSDLCLDGEKERIVVKPFHEFLSEVLSSLECDAFLRRLAEFTGMAAEVEAFLAATPNTKRTQMFKPLTEQEQMRAFEEFLAEPGNPAKVEFDRLEVFVFSQDQTIDLRHYLFEELELVRSAFTCYDNYQGYLGYERGGRSVGFQENRRQAILGILREWERFQLRRGFFDLMGLAQAAVFAVDEQGTIPDQFRYRAVLVDEFQDFSTLELLLLRSIPKFAENGLFLTGDFAQKIYAKDLNLPSAKLGRDARTDRTIRRNYRNTRQILLAAHALLKAYPPQLAGGEEDVTVLEPEYARRESAVPIATEANDALRAAWHYADAWLRGGHVPFSVCIATANPNSLSVESILKQKPANIEADVLTGDYLLKPSRVVVADISSVKGFEFSLIIVCGLDEGVFPPKGVPAAEHWREALRLYVAITRGRDEVRFIYQGKPSPFVTAMAEHIQFQTWKAPLLPEPIPEPVVQQEPEIAEKEVAPVEPPTQAAEQPALKQEALIDFFEQYKPELLNGIRVVPIPSGATQWELARALGHDQTAVSIACQGLGHFTAPNRPLPDHIIRGICDYFRCVANIIAASDSTVRAD